MLEYEPAGIMSDIWATAVEGKRLPINLWHRSEYGEFENVMSISEPVLGHYRFGVLTWFPGLPPYLDFAERNCQYDTVLYKRKEQSNE